MTLTWRNTMRLVAGLLMCLQVVMLYPVPDPSPKPDPGPKPTPIVVPTPTPDPTPVTQGQRTIVIMREAREDSPDFADMIQDLQVGEADAAITGEGHRLIVFDKDQVDENGDPVPMVTELKGVHPELPALFILREDGNPLHHETITPTMTAVDVLRILKEWDG